MTTVREAFFDVARQLGLTTIFGNPGSTEETFLKDFPSDFRYVLALQEAPAVAMADGYAQATGRPTLVNLHTAAGMGNAVGNIESAWYNRAPVIITAGQQTREMLLIEPYLTNTHPHLIAAPYVKWSYEPARAEDVPAALMRAYAVALQPPRGPVFLSIPMDDVEKPIGRMPEIRTVSHRLGVDRELLEPVAAALKQASKPLLVVGGAVDQSNGWHHAVRLAENLQSAVMSAPYEGRPGFPETHPLFRGMVTGAIGPASKQFEGHDVVVVIGAPVFRYYPYVPGEYVPKGTRLFHITDSPDEAGRAPVGTSIITDAGMACAMLADMVGRSNRSPPAPEKPLPVPEITGAVATPDYLYHVIDTLRPKDAIIVQESLSSLKALHQRLRASQPRSFYSMSSGVLGYGLPAAVGVALAERDAKSGRKVIAIIGDGAANYVIQALWTAKQHDLDILFVVPRNGAYNILKAFANMLRTPGVPGLDLPGLDFVHLANGYGVSAERVSDPHQIEPVLKAAIATKGTHLVEVQVDATVPSLI